MIASDMESYFWTAWSSINIFLVLLHFYLCFRVFHRLRKDYPEVYESIGSLSFLNNTFTGNRLFSRFLRTGRYRELGDKEITRLCQLIRVTRVFFFLIFIGGFLLSIYLNVYQ